MTEEVARRAAELQILQRVASEVNATLDLEEIYDIALATMGELFDAHHAIILLLEPDEQTLRVVASRGYENQAIGGRVRLGIGAVGVVAQKRKMMQVGNLGQQRAYASAQRRQMMKAGRAAEVGEVVPVKLHARVTETGTLELEAIPRGTNERWKVQFDVRGTSAEH